MSKQVDRRRSRRRLSRPRVQARETRRRAGAVRDATSDANAVRDVAARIRAWRRRRWNCPRQLRGRTNRRRSARDGHSAVYRRSGRGLNEEMPESEDQVCRRGGGVVVPGERVRPSGRRVGGEHEWGQRRGGLVRPALLGGHRRRVHGDEVALRQAHLAAGSAELARRIGPAGVRGLLTPAAAAVRRILARFGPPAAIALSRRGRRTAPAATAAAVRGGGQAEAERFVIAVRADAVKMGHAADQGRNRCQPDEPMMYCPMQ